MNKILSVKLLIFYYQSVSTYVLGAQSSFEYPQHMFWLKTKKTIFCCALLT